MNRLLIYVHFNKYNQLSSHVVYQLTKLNTLFEEIVFISNSQLASDDKKRLQELNLYTQFIQRENVGFDFAAWRDGMSLIGFEKLVTYESVTLMNDTCFGPLWDMSDSYEKFENDSNIDFWGITNHRSDDTIAEHIQSYFISYKKQVVQSQVFKEYWSSVETLNDVQQVIDCYEIRTTTYFLEAGFNYGVVFDTREAQLENNWPPNFSLYHPTALLRHKVPLFKVKIPEVHNIIAPYLIDYIDKNTTYPIEHMISFLSDQYLPDEPYKLAFKYLYFNNNILQNESVSVAIHFHVFYVDLLEDFLVAFKEITISYDLYITTDSEEKKEFIEQVLKDKSISAMVIKTANIGRDIVPMLQLKQYLSQYDYVGHFHTKKSKEADFWAGESWRNELIDSLIKPANNILTEMVALNLGIVIADIPSFFRLNKIVDARNESLIAPEMNRLWKRMNLSKTIDFEHYQTFVMSYGTFIWFKYDALKPLFDLDLALEEIPSEPLPQNSILHAIERLLVYIAWNEHYDFKIAPSSVELTPFIDNKILNIMQDFIPQTVSDFTQIGGGRAALRMIFISPLKAMNYLRKRLVMKCLRMLGK